MRFSTIIIISSILIILISYIYYNIVDISYTNPPPENIPKLSCQKHQYERLMEDFVKLDDNTLIACGANFADLYMDYSIYKPDYKFEQGTLVLFDIRKKRFKNLELKNFPEKLNFFPHGMELYQNKYIYVINHALNSIDGERIEVFEIIKERLGGIYLDYLRSIKLPEEFISATNGLTVVDEDDIFFSTSFPIHPPATDKINFLNKSLFFILSKIIFYLNLKLTNLYHYKNGTITKVKESNSLCDNGVAYDEANKTIFLAQTLGKNIRVFKYEKNGEINFERDIYLGYRIDNIIFDEKNRILNAGISGNGGFGGLAEIYPDKNYTIKYPFYDKINISSASAIQINKKIYLVSPMAKYLLQCE